MTNFEKIKKTMSVREMANAISNGHLGNQCDYCFFQQRTMCMLMC